MGSVHLYTHKKLKIKPQNQQIRNLNEVNNSGEAVLKLTYDTVGYSGTIYMIYDTVGHSGTN